MTYTLERKKAKFEILQNIERFLQGKKRNLRFLYEKNQLIPFLRSQNMDQIRKYDLLWRIALIEQNRMISCVINRIFPFYLSLMFLIAMIEQQKKMIIYNSKDIEPRYQNFIANVE